MTSKRSARTPTLTNLDYSRVEANPTHPNNKVKEVAHGAVVNYREPTQPNPGYKCDR
ncbi:unnamed protein product [marine sediment metagenome]|uniref:Uncharacterized protein n=1 Tax=marine sediment metagenome TaxID=412755 RepID=X0X7M8_9ZZZZ